jgi:hypothetical protein
MYIKEIISQSRRDFEAQYECEHCGHSYKSSGYDDQYFHEKVIPGMECRSCKKTASNEYVPLATKYPEGFQI